MEDIGLDGGSGSGGGGKCGSNGPGGSGISGSGKLVLLQYTDTDGRIIEVPKSTNQYDIDVDLPYRRMMDSLRMKEFAADNKYAFSFSNSIEKLHMHVSRWDNDTVGIKADDSYAGISNYHDYEGYPIWKNHTVLEKVISLKFLYGDVTTASFIYCHHAGVGKFDKTVKSHVADALETMNALLWIFLGNPWRHLMKDLVERIRSGNLKRYLNIDSRMDESTFLIFHIHDALCKISSLIRDEKPRQRSGDETDDIKNLVLDCQKILAIIPSAEDEVSHNQRLSAFREQRKCTNINEHLSKLKTAKEVKVVTPPGKVIQQPGTTKDIPNPALIVKRVCLRNVMLQWNFGVTEGWNKLCDKNCIYDHVNVVSLSRPSLEQALTKGPQIFGPAFTSEGWQDKLREAFDIPRMKAIRTVKGEVIVRDETQTQGTIVAAAPSGRGAGRAGSKPYRGRDGRNRGRGGRG